jgi:hypothetical protein
MDSLHRMANFTVDGQGDKGGIMDTSLRNQAKKTANISLPGLGGSAGTRSLFIFSEENFVRKYAKVIIEWGYPFWQKSKSLFYMFWNIQEKQGRVISVLFFTHHSNTGVEDMHHGGIIPPC